MAKKEISGYVKLQINGGQANPAPPVGPALGQRGINIMEFCKAFNEKTKSFAGKPVPVIITVYKDKKFDFVIKSEMNNDLYHMIKNIKKVSGFLGSRGTPIPVSDKEVERILGQIKDGVAQPKSAIEYNIGEKVQVIDGPFASFSGMVEDIDEEKLRLKVSVLIFGRPTPVDLEYNQVEKAS